VVYERKFSKWTHPVFAILARRDECSESYCYDPGVGISATPQGKNFNLGYIF
jgi:hypothetical protein